MAILAEYHKPQSVAEAVQLLRRTDVRLRPLAGGSQLVGALETRTVKDVDGVVDLAGLGLHRIEATGDLLRIGATATLSDVCSHQVAGEVAGGILRCTARFEGPVNLRNAATVGGVVVSAEMDSEFYASLLALGASVIVSDGERETITPLDTFSIPSPPASDHRHHPPHSLPALRPRPRRPHPVGSLYCGRGGGRGRRRGAGRAVRRGEASTAGGRHAHPARRLEGQR